jgi:hypothetical protein
VQQEQSGGLMGVMAQGMAFGVGSAIAHRAVGAAGSMLFGGDSSSDDSMMGGGGGGDDSSWDV